MEQRSTTLRVALAGLTAVSLALSGCSPRQYVVRSLGDALAEGGAVYASDDDIELIGEATPFGLKTLESLLAVAPDHRGMLLATTRGFTQYAYVYVQLPAEEAEERDVAAAYAQRERARRLYLRARDYGLRGLRLGGEAALLRLLSDPSKTLAATTRDDVALLYWTGVAWFAAIALSKDSPATIAGLPGADALIGRAAALDPDFDHGSLQTFLIGYEMNRPNAGADAEARARTHFARAVKLSAGGQAAPYVSLAESVCVVQNKPREFRHLLNQAIQLDAGAHPEWRLANLVMQRRARRLLVRADELFPE